MRGPLEEEQVQKNITSKTQYFGIRIHDENVFGKALEKAVQRYLVVFFLLFPGLSLITAFRLGVIIYFGN